MSVKLNSVLFIAVLLFVIACKKDNPTSGNNNNSSSVTTYDYGTHPRQHFDLYLPQDHDATTPVVVMVHGGAWVLGNSDNGKVTTFSNASLNLVDSLVSKGYACAVMTYRLACYNTVASNFGNNTHFYIDRMMEDVNLTIDYLKSNANTLGISPTKFGLIGESAGAHIALMYALGDNADSNLKTVISFYGPTDLDEQVFKQYINSISNAPVLAPSYISQKSNGCNMSNGNVSFLNALKSLADNNNITLNSSSIFLDSISPSFTPNITNNIPTFILHGTNDIIVPDSQADIMINQLNAVFGSNTCAASDFSCTHKMKKYNNCGHGFSGGSCQRKAVIQDVIDWLQVHL